MHAPNPPTPPSVPASASEAPEAPVEDPGSALSAPEADPVETPITPAVAASTLAVDDADDELEKAMALAEMTAALDEVPKIMERYFTVVGEDETIMDFARIREELEGTKIATLRREVEEKKPVLVQTAEAMVREAARREAVRRLDDAEKQAEVDAEIEAEKLASVPFAARGEDINFDPVIPWCIEGLMHQVGIGHLVSPPYTGKTMLGISLAMSIANGLDEWFGRKITRKGVVVYVAAEGGPAFGVNMHAWLTAHPGTTVDNLIMIDQQPLDWSSQPSIDRFTRRVEDLLKPDEEIVACFFDTQIDVMGDVDESSPELGRLLKKVQEWSIDHGCFSWMLHHTGHAEKGRGRGSSSQGGKMDTIGIISNDERTGMRTVDWVKVKGAMKPEKGMPFIIEKVAGTSGAIATEPTVLALIAAASEAEDRDRTLEKRVYEKLDESAAGHLSPSSLVTALGVNKAEGLKLIEQMQLDGKIKEVEYDKLGISKPRRGILVCVGDRTLSDAEAPGMITEPSVVEGDDGTRSVSWTGE